MAQFVALNSPPEDIFVCGTCKLAFISLPIFLEHKKTPCDQLTQSNIPTPGSSEVLLKTTLCTDTPDSVGSSLDMENNKNEIKCRLCLRTFKRMKSLLAHLKTHDGKPYQCLVCSRCFVQNSHLKRHEFSHKVWPNKLINPTSLEELTTKYVCSYCDLDCTNYNDYRTHLSNHVTLKKFKCIQGTCKALFDDVESLAKHVLLKHKDPIYGCPFCREKFKSLEDSASHQQSNHSNACKEDKSMESYKCPHCDAIFKKKDNLSLHLASENHKKPCVHCSKVFVSDKRLRLHLQIHNTTKDFQCTICGKAFSMKKYLTTHMFKHSEPQFTCNVCDLKFKRNDLLSRHFRTHQKIKYMKCPFKETRGCKRIFSRTDKLNAHIRAHMKHFSKENDTEVQKDDGRDASTIEIVIVPLSDA